MAPPAAEEAHQTFQTFQLRRSCGPGRGRDPEELPRGSSDSGRQGSREAPVAGSCDPWPCGAAGLSGPGRAGRHFTAPGSLQCSGPLAAPANHAVLRWPSRPATALWALTPLEAGSARGTWERPSSPLGFRPSACMSPLEARHRQSPALSSRAEFLLTQDTARPAVGSGFSLADKMETSLKIWVWLKVLVYLFEP